MRIVAAMSGGVDSSVAALRLKEEGYDVIGITIKTWPKEDCGKVGGKLCCSLDAIQYARSVSEDIDIPFYVIDLSKEFTEEVKDYFVGEYSKGRTPNPCIYCNSKIKFGYLLKKARQLGAEKIATGHYARVSKDKLLEAKDKHQDQSYFLYDIPKEVLSSVVFPLGECSKNEVRSMALEANLMSAEKESSQDICFASPNGGYREYLIEHGVNAFKEGDILDTDGKVLGKHKGIASYTVGQRKGIGLGMPKPVYVLKIDPGKNTITVGEKSNAMNRKIKVAGFNWLIFDKLEGERSFETRIRYNSDKFPATVTPTGDDEAVVEFKQEQFAPTPGQAAVFYEGEVVAGGGWIEEVIE